MVGSPFSKFDSPLLSKFLCPSLSSVHWIVAIEEEPISFAIDRSTTSHERSNPAGDWSNESRVLPVYNNVIYSNAYDNKVSYVSESSTDSARNVELVSKSFHGMV